MNLTEKLDGHQVGNSKGGLYRKRIKRLKRRIERHRANRDPEAQPLYGRYRGYEA